MSVNEAKSRVTVSICDETYFLVGDDEENEAQIIQAAAFLDAIMRPILKASAHHREKAAVLAALQCASHLLQSKALEHQQEEAAERLLQKIDRETQLLVRTNC